MAEMGGQPAKISLEYCLPLLKFSIASRFNYPYKAYPGEGPRKTL